MHPEEFSASIARILRDSADLAATDPGYNAEAAIYAQIDLSQYDSLFTFGDSLSDNGSASHLADLTFGLVDDPTPSEKGYFQDRFSNGYNYADQLYQEITGKSPATYFSAAELISEIGQEFSLPDGARNGVNFALGGATALPGFNDEEIPAIFDAFSPDLQAQVSLLLTGIEGASSAEGALEILDDVFGVEIELPTLPNDALYSFGFGGNDIFAFLDDFPDLSFTQADLDQFSARFTAAYRGGLNDLIDAGAKHFLISGAPNGGVAPDIVADLFPGDVFQSVEAVQPVTDALNNGLQTLLADLSKQHPNVNFFYFDPDVTPVLAHPEAFGLDPDLLSTPFIDDLEAPNSGVTLADLPDYAFIDDFHPTAAGQDFLADQARGALSVEPDLDAFFFGGDEGVGLEGGVGRDLIEGGAGGDVLTGYAAGDVIGGGDGDDQLFGVAGEDLLVGGAGADRLYGGNDADALAGGAGDDVLIGGEGADLLSGGAGRDRLKGQIGSDLLDGGAGDDKLIGGGGADTFLFLGGPLDAASAAAGRERDVIIDFQTGLDLIDLTRFATEDGGFTQSDLTGVIAAAQDSAGGAILDLDAQHRVILRGVEVAELSEDFFLFT